MSLNRTILFRADGNSSVGSGHVMRCLSIADSARVMGYHCFFVTADASFTELIKEKKHENCVLHTDYKKLGEELGVFLHMIEDVQPEMLFIDSYYVDAQYLKTIWELCQRMASKLIYVDDILAFAYPVDILVNYNIYGPDKAKVYKELYEDAGMRLPQFLLGTAYAPLRLEFQGLPEREVRREAFNILISTGGSDCEHIGLALANYIISKGEKLKNFTFHFIVGAMNEDVEELKRLALFSQQIKFYFNVPNIQEIMLNSDVAISAAGSTLYELCATQTPTLTYVLADNQVLGAEGFCKHNILKNCGDVRKLGAKRLSRRLIEEAVRLAADYESRSIIAAKMRTVVDGIGAVRIIERVME